MSEPPPKRKLPPKNAKVIQAVVPNKKYTLSSSQSNRGKKIILYGASGMGKTTLCELLSDAVFVAADDGVDVVMHPVTGKRVPSYRAYAYEDVRNILGQPELFKGYKTIVLDNMTEVENLAIPYILNTVTKDGKSVRSLEGYGWGAGYQLLAEHDGYVKYDLQRLVDLGFNVIVVCQMAPRKETSAEVEDYIKDGPKLVWRPGSKAYAVTDFVEWADYCFKLGYSNLVVNKKRPSSAGQRAVFVHPQAHFEAKARDIPAAFPLVSFSDPTDDSIWRFVFDQAWRDIEVPTDEETE
jgi:energy-coupling factor transporter ATP-binding protein EcfA2